MMRRFLQLAPIALLAIPAVSLAAPKTFQELANVLVVLMNNAVVVLLVLGLVVYFYGVSTNVMNFQKGGAANAEKIKAYFFWGIIVLFVMVSIWGILQLLQNSLFGGDQFPSAGGGGGGFVEQDNSGTFAPPVPPGTFQ